MATKETSCVFCKSKSYGKSCPWSGFANKIHLHTGDPSKCSFCGSPNIVGPGCPFSPTKYHMAGANFYNAMAQESFITSYMIHSLTIPLYETQAFKLNLINAEGNLLRKPDTIEEKMAYTPYDAYLLKIRRLLGEKIGLLNGELYLEAASRSAEMPIELYESEVKLKHQMKLVANRFSDLLDEASDDGLPISLAQKVILDSFR